MSQIEWKQVKKLFRAGEQEQHRKQDRVFNYHPQTHYARGHDGGYKSGRWRSNPYQNYHKRTKEGAGQE